MQYNSHGKRPNLLDTGAYTMTVGVKEQKVRGIPSQSPLMVSTVGGLFYWTAGKRGGGASESEERGKWRTSGGTGLHVAGGPEVISGSASGAGESTGGMWSRSAGKHERGIKKAIGGDGGTSLTFGAWILDHGLAQAV